MNIFEFQERYKISLKKARLIAKENPNWFDSTNGVADPIRATLTNGDPLPVWQLVRLIDEPGLLLDLGKYAADVERQIAALEKPENQIAPKSAAAAVFGAAKNDPEQVAILCDWLKQVIPARPVGHSYIASRLLLGIPISLRKSEAPRIGRALLNCRNHPALAGWWKVKPGVTQNSTIYQKLALDL